MRMTYDPRYNVAYIRIQEPSAEVETLRINDELNIDLTPDGRVCGIELLNANEQLWQTDHGKLIVTNTHTGLEQEVLLHPQDLGRGGASESLIPRIHPFSPRYTNSHPA